MRLYCPNCRNAIEVVGDSDLEVISCPSCGSRVSTPLATETLDFVAGSAVPLTSRTIAHFTLLEKIGTGAFGSVWRAQDTKLDRQVAIKVPRAGQFENESQFLREAQAAGRLQHPNIVTVFETGTFDGQTYIASDYIQGEDLKSRMKSRHYSVADAASLVATIARALHFAHQAGIVHRDLKPANIMLDEADVPYVMDFGLAKREAGEVTMTADGEILGTPAYMSPEQARGAGNLADGRSDVYALGVILYELLTGVRPFQGDVRTLLLQIQKDEPIPPHQLNRQVSTDLEVICLKCLEKEPRQRYQSADDLATDLDLYLARRPIKARPISRSTRALRWCQRNPWPAALMATLLTSTAITGVLAWVAAGQTHLATKNATLYSQAAEQATEEAEKSKQAANKIERLLTTSESARQQAELALDEADVNHYKNSIRTALSQLKSGDRQAAQSNLDRCPPHLRRFEWNYLRQLCQDARIRSRFESTQATFVPNSHAFVVAHLAEAIAYDLETGDEQWRLPTHQQIITARPVFTPDGNTLVTLCRGLPPGETAESMLAASADDSGPPLTSSKSKFDAVLDALDKASAELVDKQKNTVTKTTNGDLAYDHSSPYVTLYFWDWRNQKLLRRYAIPVDEQLRNSCQEQAIQFSADGKHFAFQGRKPRWLETGTGRTVGTFAAAAAAMPEPFFGLPEFFEYNPHVDQVMWSSSFDLLQVSADGFEAIAPVSNPFQRETQQVVTRRRPLRKGDRVAFVRDLLAVCDESRNTIEVRHAQTGAYIAELQTSAPVTAVAISQDQRLIAGMIAGGVVSVWDLETQRKVAEFYDLQPEKWSDPTLQFSPDGQFLMSDSPLRIWAIRQSNAVRQLPHRIAGLLGDGSRYVALEDSAIRTYDTRSAKLLHEAPIGRLYSEYISCNSKGVVDPNEKRSFELVPRGHCGYVEETSPHILSIYDAAVGKQIAQLPEFSSAVEFMSLARDVSRVAVRTADGKYSVWSYAPIRLLRATNAESIVEKGNMQLSPSGERLVVFNQKHIWQMNVATGAASKKKHPGGENEASFRFRGTCISPEGNQYVYQAKVLGPGLFLANLENDTYRALMDISLGRYSDLRFNHDGSRLIALGTKLWVIDTDTGDTLLEMPAPLPESSWSRSRLLLSNDDSRIVIGYDRDEDFLLSGWRFTNQHIVRLRGGQTRRDNASQTALLDVDIAPQGNRVATLHSDGTMRIQDCVNGRTLFEHEGMERTRYDLELLADGTEAVSVGTNRKIQRWNVENGESSWTVGTENDRWYYLRANPGETHLIALGDDGNLMLLRLDDGHQLWSADVGNATPAAARFTPDGKSIALGTTDGKIRFFALQDGKPQQTLDASVASNHPLLDFDFAPRGTHMAVIDSKALKLLDWVSGEECSHGDNLGLAQPLSIELLVSVKYDRQNRIVLHGRSFDRLFNIRFDATGNELFREWIEVESADLLSSFNDHDLSGNRLAVGLRNGDVRIVDVAGRDFAPAPIQQLRHATLQRVPDAARAVEAETPVSNWTVETRFPRGFIKDMALSRDGQLVTTSSSGALYLLDGVSGEPKGILVGHSGETTAVASSPDTDLIASAGADGWVRVWNVRTRKLLHKINPVVAVSAESTQRLLRSQRPVVSAVAISPTDDLLAIGGNDGVATLWELSSGRFVGQLIKPSGAISPITELSFSPDGTKLALAGKQMRIDVWDVAKQSHLRQLDVKHWSASLAWSPSGDRLYAADGRDLVDWELSTESREAARRVTLGGYARSLDISPDGQWLAVCAAQVAIVPSADFKAAQVLPDIQNTNSIHFSADGGKLYVGATSSVSAIDVAQRKTAWTQGYNGFQLQAASWSADGNELLFGGGLWQLGRWKLFQASQPAFIPIRGTRTTSLSPDGKQLAVASGRDALRLLSLDTNHWSPEFAGSMDGSVMVSLAWSPDASELAGLGEDGSLSLWQAGTFQRLAHVDNALDAAPYLLAKASVRWCRDDVFRIGCPQHDPEYFRRNRENGESKLLRITSSVRYRAGSGYRGGFQILSPGGRTVAQANGNRVQAWPHVQFPPETGRNPEADKFQKRVDHAWQQVDRLRALDWSPDGSFVAALDDDFGRVRIVPVSVEDARANTDENALALPTFQVNKVAWAPGPLLALLCQDNSIQLTDRRGRNHGQLVILDSGRIIFMHPSGHVNATKQAEQEYLYVVESDDGTQAAMSPANFSKAYGWKNEPQRARLRREELEWSAIEMPSPAVEIVVKGLAEINAGCYGAGADLFQQAIEADPDHLIARHYLADALLAAGRQAEARSCLLAAARKTPIYAPVNLRLGQMFLDEGHAEAARIQFGYARYADRWNELAVNGLCAAYAQLGDYKSIIALAKTATEKNWELPMVDYWHAVALFNQDKHAEAAPLIERAIAGDPAQVEYLADAVVMFQELKQPDKVAKYLRKMKDFWQGRLEKDPGNAQMSAKLGQVLSALGEMSEAAASYKAAATIAGGNAELWNTHAWILATIDDPQVRDGQAALESAEKACEISDRRDPAFLDTLAAALAAVGRFDEAIQRQQEAIELAEGNESTVAGLQEHLESFQAKQPLRLPAESFK